MERTVASLSITTTTLSAGIVVLLMRGTMRRGDIDTFRDALTRVQRTRPREVQLDFSGLVDVDAGAAAAVTAAALEAQRTGTAVTVVRASEAVRRGMTVAGGADMLR
ncbi:STAS domain-containing protein [Micromonospora deserti]|uniref:STAS domain-containing protein n=1 Tax=Micromonospora deserti TaxID=2070366 RepID=UPI001313E98B|nr:STAS domain-containing protein [Micromonospora deserti]